MRSSSKKLSLLVAGAIGFGAAFSMTPSEALAATTTVDQSGDSYSVNGQTMNFKTMLAAVKAELAKDNADVQVNGSNVATAFSGESLTLGKGSQLSVKGSTNTAKIVGGDTTSTVSVDGTAVTGDNVNLKSLTMTATDKVAKLNVTGSIDTLDASEGTIQMKRAGTLTVGTFTTKGANLLVDDGVTLTAKEATIGEGTKLSTGTGSSIVADTLTIDGAAKVDGTAAVKADTIKVTSADAATALAAMKISAKTEGGAVTVDTSAVQDSTAAGAIKTAVETAAKNSGTTINVERAITGTVTSDGQYKIGDQTVSKSEVASTLAAAYANGATQVTLDKETTKALQDQDVTVPAGKTLVVKDADGSSVSATAKTDAKVQVSGLSVTGDDGAAFSNVTVNATGKTLTNNLKNVTADNVTVNGGTVKTDDVTATNLTVNGGTVVTDATITADKVTLNGGTITATQDKVATVKANTVVVKSVDDLDGLKVEAATKGGTVTVTKADGTGLTAAEVEKVQAASASKVTYKDTTGKTASADAGYKATTVVRKTATGYTVAGDAVEAKDLAAAVNAALKNSDQVQLDKGAATALADQALTIPAGKTLVVKDSDGSSVSATAKSDSTVKLDGNKITGYSVNGDKVSFSDVTVNNQTGAVIINGIENASVDNVTVESGSIKTSNVTVKNLTLNGGTVITDDTITAETVTLNGGKIETTDPDATATVVAKTITIKDIKDLDGLKIQGVNGGAVTVKKADGTKLTANEIEAVKKASASKVVVNGTTEDGAYTPVTKFRKSGNDFLINGKKVEGDLAAAVNEALKNNDRVQLDKETTKALQDKAITIPAGKTLIVSDGKSVVSATAKKDATVTVDGNKIKGYGVDGKSAAEFTDITIDNTTGAAVVNGLENVVADNVTIANGLVKTGNVTAKNLVLGKGAEIAGINGNEPVIKADKITIADVSQLAGLTLKGATGDTVTIVKADGSKFTQAEINALRKVTDPSAKVNLNGKDYDGRKGLPLEKPDRTKLDKAEKALKDAKDATAKALDAQSEELGKVIINGDNMEAAGAAMKAKYAVANDLQQKWDALTPELEKEASVKTNPFTTKLKNAEEVSALSTQADDLNIEIAAYNSALDTYKTAIKAYQDAFDTKDSAVQAYKKALAAQTNAQKAYDEALEAYNQAMDEYKGTTTTTSKSVASAKRVHSPLGAAVVPAHNYYNGKLYAEDTNGGASYDGTTYSEMAQVADKDVTSLQNKFKAAVLDAGTTLAAPSVSAQRAALVISDVMSDNVLARTKDLRDGKAPVDQDGDNHVWFQIKHSDVDVDDSDVYKKSKVKYTNYQLGYDNKIADDAFGGAFLSTTTGSVDFKGSRANGSTDMKDSFFGGVYATQILPHGQYIDGMIHAGQFSSKYLGQSWTTKNVGATAAYGVKLQNESVMYNPYVQLRVDHVMTDDVAWAGNTVDSMSQNVFNTKLGVDVYGLNGQGLYGGIAYGHNFTGNYDATVNGFAMPTDSNRANIIYMKLGYRANIAKNTLFDLEAEKTFVDYDGWHATGRFNFFF
jgi:outer membrane autotransporter protein